MSKHTPGPWTSGKVSGDDGKVVLGIRGKDRFVGHLIVNDSAEDRANAALVLAAPDLLEALKEGIDLEASDLAGNEWKEALYAWLRTARAAIAKAEGQTDDS